MWSAIEAWDIADDQPRKPLFGSFKLQVLSLHRPRRFFALPLRLPVMPPVDRFCPLLRLTRLNLSCLEAQQ
jgi:hypothetical protein